MFSLTSSYLIMFYQLFSLHHIAFRSHKLIYVSFMMDITLHWHAK
jgi:hypothetical protein